MVYLPQMLFVSNCQIGIVRLTNLYKYGKLLLTIVEVYTQKQLKYAQTV